MTNLFFSTTFILSATVFMTMLMMNIFSIAKSENLATVAGIAFLGIVFSGVYITSISLEKLYHSYKNRK